MKIKTATVITALALSLLLVSTVQAIDAGTYRVGTDIAPGIYAGNPGTDILDSCYWARRNGVSGDSGEIIANGNARGQFYVEVRSTDSYFTVRCEITPLADWPVPPQPLSDIGTGMYIVGRDIAPGIYAGNPGTDILDSCYWARRNGVSGDSGEIIANGNARGQFYVEVRSTDSYFTVRCEITPLADWPVPPQPLSDIGTGMYIVGRDIAPGIYAGNPGTDILDSCYWARRNGVSGDSGEIIANGNARGQFYVEVRSTDSYFTVRCEVTPLADWPTPSQPLTTLDPGMYLVGRDISSGTYSGRAGDSILDSCHWKRLSGVSGEFSELIDNDNATGTYSVVVEDSDFALLTRCSLTLAYTTDTGQLSVTVTVSGAPLVRIDAPISVTATFSEAAPDFAVEDITVANGSVSDLVGKDDKTYTFNVTPNAVGVVTFDIAHGDASTSLSLGIPYDDDHDGTIGGPEILEAVRDYFGGNLTGQQILELVRLYFSQ